MTFITQHHLVILRVDLDDINRGADADAKVLALTDGVVRDTLMLSEHLAVDRDEIAGGHGAAFFLDEGGIVAVGHKADILTVGLVGIDKAVLRRDTAHLVLAQSTERESDIAQLFLRQ